MKTMRVPARPCQSVSHQMEFYQALLLLRWVDKQLSYHQPLQPKLMQSQRKRHKLDVSSADAAN